MTERLLEDKLVLISEPNDELSAHGSKYLLLLLVPQSRY